MTSGSKRVTPARKMLPIDREFNKLRILHDIDLMVRCEQSTRQYSERLRQQADNLLVGIENLQRELASLEDVDFIESIAGAPASVIPGVH